MSGAKQGLSLATTLYAKSVCKSLWATRNKEGKRGDEEEDEEDRENVNTLLKQALPSELHLGLA